MASTDTLYTARATAHECLERGRDNLLKQPMVRAGVNVAPSSGTVTVYNASGTVVVANAAVTITASVAEYNLGASTLAGEPLGEGWSIVWSLTMPDGVEHTVRRSASLVVSRLHPPASAADLFQRIRALNPAHASPITALTLADFDDYLDAAWLQIEDRLKRRGRRPWLVVSSEALRELQIVGTLALIFEDLATRNQEAHGPRAQSYREQARLEWAETRFEYLAEDTTGAASSADQAGAGGTLWLQHFPVDDRWGG